MTTTSLDLIVVVVWPVTLLATPVNVAFATDYPNYHPAVRGRARARERE